MTFANNRKIAANAEFALIAQLHTRINREPSTRARLSIPIGDDSAEVLTPHERTLFATDMLLDGVHFHIDQCGARAAGRKALAVNLSDIAAMAGTATVAVVSLALPRANAGMRIADEAMQGVEDLARSFDIAIAGGDTNAWDGPFAINVAVLGVPHPRGSVTRAGARPGDLVMVTGSLGGSIHGRHLSFVPRLREAWQIHDEYGLSAMIDLSDGVASDLRHVLNASRCGAILDRQAIPIHDDVQHVREAKDPLTHALSDGEDFELCFTLPAPAARRLQEHLGLTLPTTIIGEIVAGDELRWQEGDLITEHGFAHAF